MMRHHPRSGRLFSGVCLVIYAALGLCTAAYFFIFLALALWWGLENTLALRAACLLVALIAIWLTSVLLIVPVAFFANLLGDLRKEHQTNPDPFPGMIIPVRDPDHARRLMAKLSLDSGKMVAGKCEWDDDGTGFLIVESVNEAPPLTPDNIK